MERIKRIIKDILAAIVYFLYKKHILHNRIRVHGIDETIDVLLNTKKSMVRFGDGEIVIIRGRDCVRQEASPEIGQGLAKILTYPYDDLIVTIPDVFDSLDGYNRSSRQFFRDHLLFCRKIYEKYCNPDKTYYTTFVSRCYYIYEDKSNCERWFSQIKKIWENRDVVVVEGAGTHNGVGNDLLDSAGSVERIICPPKNAYTSLQEIVTECRRYDKDRLFLVSLGVAAKFIVQQLFEDGYRVLDIGNLDMEYEWFLRKASGKMPLEKHKILGKEANEAAGYKEYVSQVRVWMND